MKNMAGNAAGFDGDNNDGWGNAYDDGFSDGHVSDGCTPFFDLEIGFSIKIGDREQQDYGKVNTELHNRSRI